MVKLIYKNLIIFSEYNFLTLLQVKLK